MVKTLVSMKCLNVKSDKWARVDMQCLIDVPMSGRVETVEIGPVSNVQFCFYDRHINRLVFSSVQRCRTPRST